MFDDDRIYFEPGDKLLVHPMRSTKEFPASKILVKQVVRALDQGCSGGLDVYDIVDENGNEDSIYGVQVKAKY